MFYIGHQKSNALRVSLATFFACVFVSFTSVVHVAQAAFGFEGYIDQNGFSTNRQLATFDDEITSAGIDVATSGDIHAGVKEWHAGQHVLRINGDNTVKDWFGVFSDSAEMPDGLAVAPDGTPSAGDTYVFAADDCTVILSLKGCPAEIRQLYQYSADGSFKRTIGSFSRRAGERSSEGASLAVAPSTSPESGDLYVTDRDYVSVFSHDGKFKFKFGSPGKGDGQFEFADGIDVSASGDVYIVDRWLGRVQVFSPKGVYKDQFSLIKEDVGVSSLTINPLSGDIYLGGGRVAVYSPTGTLKRRFSADNRYAGNRVSDNGPYMGIAVEDMAFSPVNGKLYIADGYGGRGFGAISVYGDEAIPLVGTGTGASVSASSVRLSGSVNPQGESTVGYFEYGLTDTYGQKTGSVNVGSGNSYVDRSEVLSGLEPGTTYHYRFVGKSKFGTIVGKDQTFTTNVAVVTGTADGVGVFSARLKGSVDPQGEATSYAFEYGKTAGYGNVSPGGSAGPGNSYVQTNEVVKGLEPNTTYHYRVVATNRLRKSLGQDMTFTTGSAVTTGAVDSVDETSALVHGVVNPDNEPGQFYVEYGKTAGYGSSTVLGDAGSGGSAVTVKQLLTGLEPGTTYHYRVAFVNRFFTTVGGGMTFQTKAAQPKSPTNPPAGSENPSPPANAKCVVPKLRKVKLSRAKTLLKRSGCQVGKVTKKRVRKRSLVGAVLSQRQKPGQELQKNSKIDLVIGKK